MLSEGNEVGVTTCACVLEQAEVLVQLARCLGVRVICQDCRCGRFPCPRMRGGLEFRCRSGARGVCWRGGWLPCEVCPIFERLDFPVCGQKGRACMAMIIKWPRKRVGKESWGTQILITYVTQFRGRERVLRTCSNQLITRVSKRM